MPSSWTCSPVRKCTPGDRRPALAPRQPPVARPQDGGVKRDYTAREVTGDEKALWWERAVEAWPDYAKYQARTDRQIPVFVLDAME